MTGPKLERAVVLSRCCAVLCAGAALQVLGLWVFQGRSTSSDWAAGVWLAERAGSGIAVCAAALLSLGPRLAPRDRVAALLIGCVGGLLIVGGRAVETAGWAPTVIAEALGGDASRGTAVLILHGFTLGGWLAAGACVYSLWLERRGRPENASGNSSLAMDGATRLVALVAAALALHWVAVGAGEMFLLSGRRSIPHVSVDAGGGLLLGAAAVGLIAALRDPARGRTAPLILGVAGSAVLGAGRPLLALKPMLSGHVNAGILGGAFNAASYTLPATAVGVLFLWLLRCQRARGSPREDALV